MKELIEKRIPKIPNKQIFLPTPPPDEPPVFLEIGGKPSTPEEMITRIYKSAYDASVQVDYSVDTLSELTLSLPNSAYIGKIFFVKNTGLYFSVNQSYDIHQITKWEDDLAYEFKNYSLIASFTGKLWIDGRKIYRLVIPMKVYQALNQSIICGFTMIYQVIKVKAMISETNELYADSIVSGTTIKTSLQFTLNPSNNLTHKGGANQVNANSYYIIEFTKL